MYPLTLHAYDSRHLLPAPEETMFRINTFEKQYHHLHSDKEHRHTCTRDRFALEE